MKHPDEAYYRALLACLDRYSQMITFHPRYGEFGELKNFIDWEFRKGIEDKLPLMKLNRWLGYIQGVLINEGITTVTIERDWTRPIFRPLDFPTAEPTDTTDEHPCIERCKAGCTSRYVPYGHGDPDCLDNLRRQT